MATLPLTDLATQINQEHACAMEHAHSAIQRARRAGELLISAKEQVTHGQWLPWLSQHCPNISERTSQGYMRLARYCLESPQKAAHIESLTLKGALTALAAPKAQPVADLLPWHGDDVSWLPENDVLLRAVVDDGPGDPGILYIQQSAQNRGYYHTVQLYDDTYNWHEGGIHGTTRPVIAEAATWAFKQSFRRDPTTIEWEEIDAKEGLLDKLTADYLPAPWLVRRTRAA